MTETKPCPFCGSPAMQTFGQVLCSSDTCDVGPMTAARWNTRAPVVVTGEMVDRAYDAFYAREFLGEESIATLRAALEAALNRGTK